MHGLEKCWEQGTCNEEPLWAEYLSHVLATAKEQTKSASEDERNVKAGEKLLRYVTREPNLRVKRSCTGLGNLEVFLFVFIVSKDYVLG
jgi:hypothetical protein